MDKGAPVYLVTRGIYSDERAAGIYPSLARAQAQFPDASWQERHYPASDLKRMWDADNVVVGYWASGRPVVDSVTIYEMTFDQDILTADA